MQITAYTTRDLFTFKTSVPYDRIVGLRTDGSATEAPNEQSGIRTRTLEMAPAIGARLIKVYQCIVDRAEPTNCHRAAREIVAAGVSQEEPVIDFSKLREVTTLSEGAVGVIGLDESRIVHSIAYGLGKKGLQNLSCFGAFGFADNADVIDYHKSLFPENHVGLYELPLDRQQELLTPVPTP